MLLLTSIILFSAIVLITLYEDMVKKNKKRYVYFIQSIVFLVLMFTIGFVVFSSQPENTTNPHMILEKR